MQQLMLDCGPAAGIPFQEIHDYSKPTYYEVPNEDTMVWRDAVKQFPIYRAAAICSAGEVGLLGILPLVRKELVLVDHSRKSLYIAVVKYMLLREKGWKETRRLLIDAKPLERWAAVQEILPLLPPTLRDAFTQHHNDNPFSWCNEFGATWKPIPTRVIRKAASKLERVQFQQADLNDLIEQGPFDLLYISNAQDHSGRNGVPILSQLAQAVKPGRYLMMATTSASSNYRTRAAGLELVTSNKSRMCSWAHNLYRVPLTI